VKRAAATETLIAASSAPLYLGNNADNDDPLVGSIDEVRVSSVPRYASDGKVARARAALMDVAVFNFEASSGNVAHNTRLGAGNLALHGTTWVGGRTGNGLRFDGANSYAAGTFGTYAPSALSVGGWFKFADTSSAQVLVDQANGVGLAFTGSHLRAPLAGLTEKETNICAWVPEADTWYEIYATYDGSAKAVWVDNQKLGELAVTGTAAIAGVCYVGRASAGGSYFNGVMDDLTISRYARRRWTRGIRYFVVGQAGMKTWEDWQMG